MALICRICNNGNDNRIHTAREMMFGTRETFDYFECGACGTLQIADVPELAKYYQDDYYSLRSDRPLAVEESLLRRFAARQIGRHLTGRANLFGRYFAAKRPWIFDEFPRFLREMPGGLRSDVRILDVGSGTGELLRKLAVFGFSDLTGADPFLRAESSGGPICVLKRSVEDIEGTYELVMANHVIEHVPDPRATLRAMRGLVAEGGRAVVRIPVLAEAWRRYGVDWVQLDAPRHLYLFTEETFTSVLKDAGWHVESVMYDSTAFQFFASEQYAGDIPLHDERAYIGDAERSIFTADEIAGWEAEAERLNRERQGDQAVFYLR